MANAVAALSLPPGRPLLGALVVCLLSMLVSASMWLPLWHRLPHRSTLWLVPVALTLIGARNVLGGVDPFRYGIFQLLIFVWIGMHHRPGTSLRAAPLATASYVLPLVLTGLGPRWESLAFVLPIYVVVGEVLSRRSEQLWRLAHLDEVTGLQNRRSFLQHLDAVAHQRGRSRTRRLVVFVDLDDFKQVNDAFGHAAGDGVLRAVAAALSDVTGPGDVVGRLGGDEFALLFALGPTRDPRAVVTAVQRALERIDLDAVVGRHHGARGTALSAAGSDRERLGMLRASVGSAEVDPSGDVRTALHEADARMYVAKDSNRRSRSRLAEALAATAGATRSHSRGAR